MIRFLFLFLSDQHFNTLFIFICKFMKKFGFNRYAVSYYYGLHIGYYLLLKIFISFLGLTPEYFFQHHIPVIPAVVSMLTFDILPDMNPNWWFCDFRDWTDLSYVLFGLLSLETTNSTLFFFKFYLKIFF